MMKMDPAGRMAFAATLKKKLAAAPKPAPKKKGDNGRSEPKKVGPAVSNLK